MKTLLKALAICALLISPAAQLFSMDNTPSTKKTTQSKINKMGEAIWNKKTGIGATKVISISAATAFTTYMLTSNSKLSLAIIPAAIGVYFLTDKGIRYIYKNLFSKKPAADTIEETQKDGRVDSTSASTSTPVLEEIVAAPAPAPASIPALEEIVAAPAPIVTDQVLTENIA